MSGLVEGGSGGLGVRCTGLELHFYHLLAVWPWESHLTSLSLSFFINKWVDNKSFCLIDLLN